MLDDTKEFALARCRDAVESMTRFGLAPTPRHYAIWYLYHARRNLALRRALDIVISNGRPVDEGLMLDLYETFFSSGAEERTLRETAQRVQATLQDISGLLAGAGSDAARYSVTLDAASLEVQSGQADLPELIARLLAETRALAARNERLGRRLDESAKQMSALERELEDARREATIDGLTGLMNRRAFDEVIRAVAGEAMNSGDPLALLMLDIDHFKEVNDSWGHAVGDAVLQLVARRLAQRARAEDRPARFGGEEFVVLLPGTTLQEAAAIGDAIRADLESQRLVLRDTQQPIGAVTASIGAAVYEPGERLADWIARADAALYQAKAAGRNRVVTAPSSDAARCSAERKAAVHAA
ncbi:MAG: GGDEF domain-containing protein [Acetobacteraceae bacterium]|nr:GGDEF domain-containing protein [Acetobacteraceae bacterium]